MRPLPRLSPLRMLLTSESTVLSNLFRISGLGPLVLLAVVGTFGNVVVLNLPSFRTSNVFSKTVAPNPSKILNLLKRARKESTGKRLVSLALFTHNF